MYMYMYIRINTHKHAWKAQFLPLFANKSMTPEYPHSHDDSPEKKKAQVTENWIFLRWDPITEPKCTGLRFFLNNF